MKLSYSCKEASRLLSARQDEGLAFLSAILLRHHLKKCTNCSNFSEQMKRLSELMHELGKDEAAASPPSAAK